MPKHGLSLMNGWTPAGAEPHAASEPQTCVANIDTAGRRQRLVSGVVEVVVAAGILSVLLATHASPLWRLPLFLLFAGAATGYFQWSDRT